MGAQFGRWNFNGESAARDYLDQVRALLRPYGPDDEGGYSRGGVDLLYCALHTTEESRRETQPHSSQSGAVIAWDGRLDNREELVRELSAALSLAAPDVFIVAAAYDRWGTDCFRRLLGDWALSIWDPGKRSLVLAKDFLGIRHLHYSTDRNRVVWSTILDPLILPTRSDFALNEEYIAGWLSYYPAAHLTPYVGIHSVPPACFVTLTPGNLTIRKYWEFDAERKIRYRTDAEYEEHFRVVLSESVRRRLRSSSPILAELSGGMDSSSIVCMADRMAAEATTRTPRIDTVSYYNDCEPHWNERPYFTKVEEKRGRTGLHVNTSVQSSPMLRCDHDDIVLLPGGTRRSSSTALIDWMNTHGHRVVLSGIGGDELTGGIPTPLPELEDLFVRARFKALAHQLKIWALQQRRPWFRLLGDTMREFFPPTLASLAPHQRPGAWLRPEFVRRNRSAFLSYEKKCKLFGALPSFQQNLRALEVLRRQLACVSQHAEPLFEKRYPYLDRDLLEFMYAVPREQVVRPGHRRSLMRRSLVGIVPEEILNRNRKAYVSRSPIAAISNQYAGLADMCGDMVSGSLGFVIPELLRQALEDVRRGQSTPSISLVRTLGIECWLQGLKADRILAGNTTTFPHAVANEIGTAVTVSTS